MTDVNQSILLKTLASLVQLCKLVRSEIWSGSQALMVNLLVDADSVNKENISAVVTVAAAGHFVNIVWKIDFLL